MKAENNGYDDPNIILQVRFYKTENGNEPVRDWVQSLSREEKKTIGEDIKTVQFSWPVGMPLIKKLESDLWEIRSNLNNKIARILFTLEKGNMILLHGLIKKSQKTPQQDLDLARQRLKKLQGGQQQ